MDNKDKKFSDPRWNDTTIPINVGKPRELTEEELEDLKELEEFAKKDMNKRRS